MFRSPCGIKSAALFLALANAPMLARQAQVRPFETLYFQAWTLAGKRHWAEAIARSRMALKASGNEWDTYKAGVLLYQCQRENGDLKGARKTVDQMMEDPGQDYFLSDWKGDAARLAYLDHDSAAGLGMEAKILQPELGDPLDWTLQARENLLSYRAAGVTLPILAGPWLADELHCAQGEAWPTTLHYAPIRGEDAQVNLELHYWDGAPENRPTHDKEEGMEDLEASPASPGTTSTFQPDPVLAKAFAAKGGNQHPVYVRFKVKKKEYEVVTWVLSAGNWELDLSARWETASSSAFEAGLANLVQALTWAPPPSLSQEEAARQASSWRDLEQAMEGEDWARAETLARSVAPSMIFPHQRALAATAQAFAACRRGDFATALPILEEADRSWNYGHPGGPREESWQEQVQLWGERASMSLGRTQEASRWGASYVRSHLDLKWNFEATSGLARYQPSGLSLPPSLGDFILTNTDDYRVYYRRFPETQILGITLLSQKQSVPPPLQETVNHMKVVALEKAWGLQVIGEERRAFPPAAVDGAEGAFFLFHVIRPSPDSRGAVDVSAQPLETGAREMGIWASQRGPWTILLRSEWAPGDAAAFQAAREAAQTFPWKAPRK